MNCAGQRRRFEEAIAACLDVAECAVFGVGDALPLGLVVRKSGVTRDAGTICEELVQRVRKNVGPVANFRKVGVVARLLKSRSGKIVRGAMRRIADGGPFTVPPTIDAPATLEEIAEALRGPCYEKREEGVIGG